MVRMKVKVVGIDQHTMMPVVVITDAEERGFIPIVIGPAEANAITIQMEGIKPPRPITHDLLKNVLDGFGAKVSRVVITDLKDETYYARIYLKTAQGEIDIDARPSDAIALALRTDAPIFISEEVAAKAMVIHRDDEDEELEEFRKFLDNVTPEDFAK
ncbi:MAG: bifunctional nuclease family protein [Limnochordia bacterium]|jgi:bifunctional DNase/RNase|nr:bifunctional nuclease family protein [Bacillota bacterium]